LKRSSRFHGLEPLVEVVHGDLEELAIGHRRQRFLGIARKIRHNPHHEGELNLLLGAVQLDVVLDLDAGRSVARDELLTAHETTCLL
jgi:hypothetical protein